MLGTKAKTMRAEQPAALWRIASARMPTRWGTFDVIGFERDISNGTARVETALAISLGDLTEGAPLLRIHSQCVTGELLGSLRCDCRDQLEMAMQAIAEEGRGLVIYEYQEGRGIGLMAKLEAYELQDAGLDTVEANHALGFKADCRDFGLPAAIVRELGIKRVRLLSNNPRKASALAENGIEVIPVPCEAPPNPHSFAYLSTKKQRMGHALSLRQGEAIDQTRDNAVRSHRAASAMCDLHAGHHNQRVDVALRARGIEAQL
jgi:GTP cyclohydrolase II